MAFKREGVGVSQLVTEASETPISSHPTTPEKPTNSSLGFLVDDVRANYQQLNDGGNIGTRSLQTGMFYFKNISVREENVINERLKCRSCDAQFLIYLQLD